MKIQHLCWEILNGKIEIFTFLDGGKVVTLLLQKQNVGALEIFNHNSHLPRLKMSRAQTFCVCNSNVTTFPSCRKCKKFNFSLYTVPAEIIYIQSISRIFKNFFCLKDAEGGYCCWKFKVYRHFAFSVATLPLFHHPENVKISIFPFTLSQQKCYIFKNI